MSLIFGIFARLGGCLTASEFRNRTEGLRFERAVRSDYWTDGRCCLGRFSSPSSGLFGGGEPIFDFDFEGRGRVVVLADVRLDNREELSGKLGLGIEEKGEADSFLIAHAFVKWGDSLAEHLVGDFAIAIWDERAGRLLLIRDHIGVKPLYYFESSEWVVFASDPASLRTLHAIPEEVDWEWMACSMVGNFCSGMGGRTHIKGVNLLSNASVRVVDASRSGERRYWELQPLKGCEGIGQRESLEGFRELLALAVKDRLRGSRKIGVELSAGLDSGAIAWQASNADSSVGKEFRAYHHTNGPDGDGQEDETELAAEFCRWLGWGELDLVSGSDASFLSILREGTSLRAGPAFDLWSLFCLPLYRRAGARGSDILLSGAGGDELSTGSVGAAYREELRNGKVGWVWSELRKEDGRRNRGVARSVSRILRLLLFRNARDRYGRGKWQLDHFLNPEFAKRYDLKDRMRDQLWRETSMPLKERQVFRVTRHYLSDARLPESSFSATRYGLELRHPMLDKRLLEFCLAVPLQRHRGHGYGRYLLRGSMVELPEWMRWREAKSIAAIPWISSCLRADRVSLENWVGRLPPEASGIVNMEKIREFLKSGTSSPMARVSLWQALGCCAALEEMTSSS